MNILIYSDRTNNTKNDFNRFSHHKTVATVPLRKASTNFVETKNYPRTESLTALLTILTGVEKLQSSETKALVLLGIWRGTGVSWDRFSELFDVAIAAQEVIK